MCEILLSYAMPSNCTAYNCCNRSDEDYALFKYLQDETIKRELQWLGETKTGSLVFYKNFARYTLSQPKSNLLLDANKLSLVQFSLVSVAVLQGIQRIIIES
ncbi:uncharacterized protein LOC116853365 [Odontomachus brunneus]|uniref:uncharacterized protein LOC116853365 n=1 Tax=Odontomachus brunneus TaxID=486640 RepID=UPI0013F28273|nr:uncharacterized protein LOC116853365 [Odontomachus brunneus]